MDWDSHSLSRYNDDFDNGSSTEYASVQFDILRTGLQYTFGVDCHEESTDPSTDYCEMEVYELTIIDDGTVPSGYGWGSPLKKRGLSDELYKRQEASTETYPGTSYTYEDLSEFFEDSNNPPPP